MRGNDAVIVSRNFKEARWRPTNRDVKYEPESL